MTEPNNWLLRQHVTRVGFDLTVTKTQIAALVYIDQVRLAKWDAAAVNSRKIAQPGMRRAFNNFATGCRGLQERGLMIHTPPKTKAGQRTVRDSDGTWHFYWEPGTWKITRAGRLVINLLKEAGLYQEYLAALDVRQAAAS